MEHVISNKIDICAVTETWLKPADDAPEKTKTVKKKPAMPWYNDEVKGLKHDRRKAERQWLQYRGDPIKM